MKEIKSFMHSNWFRVKHPSRVHKQLSRIVNDNGDSVNILEESDMTGTIYFSFFCYGSLVGIECNSPRASDNPRTNMEVVLQGLLPEDESIILIETGGNEEVSRMRCKATIITSKFVEHTDFEELLYDKFEKLENSTGYTMSNHSICFDNELFV